MASMGDVRVLLVPGGGNSGPLHWHTHWQADDPHIERVMQQDWTGGSREQWVGALDRHVRSSERPTILVPHSLGCIVVCQWAATRPASTGPVVGAMLVAPADVDAEWPPEGSPYRNFRPVPFNALLFPAVLVASTNDPFLSLSRAREFTHAWQSRLELIGALGHIGSDSALGNWEHGRALLDELIRQAKAQR
jgi:predicted alpha/beta hydrolase family esterase